MWTKFLLNFDSLSRSPYNSNLHKLRIKCWCAKSGILASMAFLSVSWLWSSFGYLLIEIVQILPNFLVQKFSIVHTSSFLFLTVRNLNPSFFSIANLSFFSLTILTSPILFQWTKYSLSFPGNAIIHNSDLSAYVLSVLFFSSSSVHTIFCEGCLLSTNRLISHTVRTDLSDSLNEAVAKSASD